MVDPYNGLRLVNNCAVVELVSDRRGVRNALDSADQNHLRSRLGGGAADPAVAVTPLTGPGPVFLAADCAERTLCTELDQPGVGPRPAAVGPLVVDGRHGPVARAPAPWVGNETHGPSPTKPTIKVITRLAHAGVMDTGATPPDTGSA